MKKYLDILWISEEYSFSNVKTNKIENKKLYRKKSVVTWKTSDVNKGLIKMYRRYTNQIIKYLFFLSSLAKFLGPLLNNIIPINNQAIRTGKSSKDTYCSPKKVCGNKVIKKIETKDTLTNNFYS